MQDYVSVVNQPKSLARTAVRILKNLLWPSVIAVLTITADQISKIWAVNHLTNNSSMSVIGDTLMFTLIYNEGGAMGTKIGPSNYYLVMALLVLPFIFWYIYHERDNKTMSLPLSFIAGGAVGNLIDRIRLGEIIDFIDVDIPDINLLGYTLNRWWTFNIADAAISCGIIFLIVNILILNKASIASLESKNTQKDKKKTETPPA